MGRGIALLFHDRGTRRGWVVSSTPRPHFTPPEKTRYPFYRRLGGPQGWFGRTENLVPTGIRSRTVQPVVSRYTDWATGPKKNNSSWSKIFINVDLLVSYNYQTFLSARTWNTQHKCAFCHLPVLHLCNEKQNSKRGGMILVAALVMSIRTFVLTRTS